jgi:hypothetical protein
VTHKGLAKDVALEPCGIEFHNITALKVMGSPLQEEEGRGFLLLTGIAESPAWETSKDEPPESSCKRN